MSLALRVLLALLAGLAIGLGIATQTLPGVGWVSAVADPIGALWVGAIRMTIVPLVVSSLILAVGGAPDIGTVGRVGARALALFLLLLSVAALLGVLAGPPVVAMLTIDPAAALALREHAAATGGSVLESAKAIPTVAQFVVDLVPTNPIKAAADGAMLPLIVFALAFGAALTRVAERPRTTLLEALRGIEQGALTLVRWVLAAAPVGVFALAITLGAKLGVAAIGALATYVGLVSGATVLFCVLVLYPIAVVFGRIPLRTFARGALPPQAVAFSSRSSLAALPAMLDSARDRLDLDERVIGFLLPLAVALFRCGAAIGQTIGAIFVARLYDVPLGPMQLATIAITSVVTTLSVPGIPGGSILMMVPVLMSAGLPAAGMGILLGVDTIPDMFRTTTNITADVVVATILGRPADASDRRSA
jgi:proton glutamate symport protein